MPNEIKNNNLDIDELYNIAKGAAKRYKFILNKHEDFEDLVHEAIVIILRYKDSFDPNRGMKFTTFCFSLAKYGVLIYLNNKNQKVIRNAYKVGTGIDIANMIEDHSPSGYQNGTRRQSIVDSTNTSDKWEFMPEKEAIHKDMMLVVNKLAKDALTDKERRVMEMYYLEGIDFPTMGKISGVSKQACQKVCQKAINKIREGLKSGNVDYVEA